MTTARKYQISLGDTPYYHIISRCVRHSYLCGADEKTGQSYEHRRQWIEDRIRLLSSVFAIDILSYVVMSNHYHIVLKIDALAPKDWSFDEVIQRWLCLHKGPFLIQKYQKGGSISAAEKRVLDDIVDDWRTRLCSLSEFMQQLNQVIARQANIEENCTGRFWEGRYKSHPLLSEQVLLTAMAYVDLNPIRAKIATTPENSSHTSIKERIKPTFNVETALENNPDVNSYYFKRFHLKNLATFEKHVGLKVQHGILFNLSDYLMLVDTTGRIQREGKRGYIPPKVLSIFERLSINPDDWLDDTKKFEDIFYKKFYYRRIKKVV
ncbi:MAG: transposase [Spongiibacteraceae bacterium]|nr:transposase [Spongiibacteraceae bacterium]